jgi:hypothetical protein
MQRPRGNEMKDGFLAVNDEGVARVVAALEADDDVGIVGEEIDDLSFAFVSPLGADNCDVGHLVILDFGFGISDSI